MRLRVEADLQYRLPKPADVLLAIEAAPTLEQKLLDDRLRVNSLGALRTVQGDDGIGRRTWVRANGELIASYQGTFLIEREPEPLLGLPVTPHHELPADVIPYLWPSRFCQSDVFVSFVEREFAGLEGGALIAAMASWIHDHIDYRIGSSHEKTSAVDTFLARSGVCRDYAHVMAALTRAAGIPARLVSTYAWQLKPEDFHAVVDVWLDGRWRLVDASGLASTEGLVRIAVGRDATDIAFMTVFGRADFVSQVVHVSRLDEASIRG
ncbi:transglutaminase-like domain-containing protein [Aureimonas phyllosphaerae]|uniref:Transglutaminase-like putative cysteine protease n=1 Tax=Aureimonas phyllosphaerae TaxID=1166078 RepID=A0A7W6BUL9_9HYPH|nr:transglutaminase family protein [Aureimonas phyllosphaerae]MBB3938314.1 transglutaminase-like putative cysteine protease [Aureimonas phyllosphaerae]MBB3962321.1 transglutaminase-like putative cysteine protease [Aureimonas phyllosphaerae]SFF59401.1 Transglutaminase-like enzyme, putative cysteine protease [Aureimonas phyllosphaerae]